jgi:hypothetical protein
MPTGNQFPPRVLAYALVNVSTDEAAYWRTRAKEADLSEQIAPVFTAEAGAERVWLHQFKRGAFPNRAAAKAALQRDVDRALEPGLRLMRRANVLQPRAHAASRHLASDFFTLRFELRDDANARRTALHLMHDDPRGFLAQNLNQLN